MNTRSVSTPATDRIGQGAAGTPARPLAAWRRWMRRLYLLTAVLFAAGIAGQVFLAGAAVLVDPTYWSAHRTLGNTLELATLALLLIGLGTRLPWRIQAVGGLLYVLLFMQYVFLYLMPQIGAPLLRALHAVNALVLFGATAVLAIQIYRESKEKEFV